MLIGGNGSGRWAGGRGKHVRSGHARNGVCSVSVGDGYNTVVETRIMVIGVGENELLSALCENALVVTRNNGANQSTNERPPWRR